MDLFFPRGCLQALSAAFMAGYTEKGPCCFGSGGGSAKIEAKSKPMTPKIACVVIALGVRGVWGGAREWSRGECGGEVGDCGTVGHCGAYFMPSLPLW